MVVFQFSRLHMFLGGPGRFKNFKVFNGARGGDVGVEMVSPPRDKCRHNHTSRFHCSGSKWPIWDPMFEQIMEQVGIYPILEFSRHNF
jgi:hypothetical protein